MPHWDATAGIFQCNIITNLTYGLVTICIPLFSMIIFGLMTISNVHQARRRVRNIAMITTNQNLTSHGQSGLKMDQHLLRMLFLQILLLLIFCLPTSSAEILFLPFTTFLRQQNYRLPRIDFSTIWKFSWRLSRVECPSICTPYLVERSFDERCSIYPNDTFECSDRVFCQDSSNALVSSDIYDPTLTFFSSCLFWRKHSGCVTLAELHHSYTKDITINSSTFLWWIWYCMSHRSLNGSRKNTVFSLSVSILFYYSSVASKQKTCAMATRWAVLSLPFFLSFASHNIDRTDMKKTHSYMTAKYLWRST